MFKNSKLPLVVVTGLFFVACGSAKNATTGDLDSLLSGTYEDQDASVEVDQQKFDAFMLDSFNENSFALAGSVAANAPAAVKVSESDKGAPDAQKPEMPDAEKKAKVSGRLKEMKQEREKRVEKQHDKISTEKARPKENEKPAFRIAFEDSKQYVMALVGIDKSPFETFRAALVDAKASAASEADYKTAADAAKATFETDKAAAWKLVQAGVEEHKTEIEGIRAQRKLVVAACALDKSAETPFKAAAVKPDEASKQAPSADEIAARKMARETERKGESDKKDERKAKAESQECTDATTALKALIGQ